MSDYKELIITGLQRTGTNFLTSILEQNLKNVNVQSHSKHSLNPELHYNLNGNMFLISKNPYTWVESICYRNRVDICGFHSGYCLSDNDGIFINDINLNILIKLYRDFYNTLLSHNPYYIRYEDLLDKRYITKLLIKVSRLYKLPLNGSITIPSQVPYSDYFQESTLEYYKNQSLVHLLPEHIDIINQGVGDILFNQLGYRKL